MEQQPPQVLRRFRILYAPLDLAAPGILILEFENDTIEQLQDEMADRLGGFTLVRHKLGLCGLCPKAAGQKNGYCPDESS